ncbi:MAG: ARPP-1 family domain-containing protein [Ignavibacterium sp.]
MNIQVQSFNKQRRLSVLQFSTPAVNTFEYISGPSAIEKNLIEVREVSIAGSVNNLQLVNLSDKYIFFLDGDILVGAKQNRVLNTSVFVAPNSKINLPVSCVEQGRWRSISEKFRSSDYISPDILRAKKLKAVTKNLKQGRGHFADQGEVWDTVLNYSMNLEAFSESSDLTEVMNKKRESLDSFIKQFPLNKSANGLAIFTDNSPLSIDLFNRTDIFQEYYPKRLRSAATEVFNLKEKENTITEAEAKFKTLNLFDQLETMESSLHNGVGVGTEKRWDSDNIVAMELKYMEHLIHFTLLNLDPVKN